MKTLFLPFWAAVLFVPALAGAQAPTEPEPHPATVVSTPAAEPLSKGLGDVAKLAKAGVAEPVILAFVRNSQVAYQATAQDIIHLRELGVSDSVITAALNRGNELRQQANASQQTAPPPAAAPAQATSPVQPATLYTPSPAPAAASPAYYPEDSYPASAGYYGYPYAYGYSYPNYYYSYPSYCYSYPRYYYPHYYPRYYGCNTFYPYGSARFSVGFNFGSSQYSGHGIHGHPSSVIVGTSHSGGARPGGRPAGVGGFRGGGRR